MLKSTFEKAVEAFGEAVQLEVNLRLDYEYGYGRTAPAFTVRSEDLQVQRTGGILAVFATYLMAAEAEDGEAANGTLMYRSDMQEMAYDISNVLLRAAWDSMGKGQVFFFPDLELEDDEEEES